MSQILVVEDDSHIREMLHYILQKEDFSPVMAASAEQALELCVQALPDLIVLDIQLPGINGYQFCERLQKQLSGRQPMPSIIMLTEQAEVSDFEKGLGSFADDYVAKPFNPRLLVARINACLRRSGTQSVDNDKSQLSLLGVEIDLVAHRVKVQNEFINLQKMEFEILHLLMASPNRVFSRDAIISHCKGDNYFVSDRAIDNQIYKLRKKLGEAGQHLKTVSGLGYRFTSEIS